MEKKGNGDNLSEARQKLALMAMCNLAEKMGIDNGVATVLVKMDDDVYPRIAFSVVNNIERDPDPSRGEDDTGTNYFGVVMSKNAEMMSTHTNSGQFVRRPKVGELPYRGGLIKRVAGGYVYTGFSGGTEDEDVVIGLEGMKTLGLRNQNFAQQG